VERSGDNGEEYESHCQGFVGKTQGAISFGTWSVRVSVTKMEVSRDVVGSLFSKMKDVGDA